MSRGQSYRWITQAPEGQEKPLEDEQAVRFAICRATVVMSSVKKMLGRQMIDLTSLAKTQSCRHEVDPDFIGPRAQRPHNQD
jgi:hypothetical protein